jgi:hypothetical protein
VYYTPKYEVQEVVVPKAVKAYVSPDYFASVSDYYRDKVMLDAIAGKSTDASKLAQELAEIKQQLKGQSQSPPPQAQYQQPVYQPQVQAPMAPQSTYAPSPQQQGYAPSGGTPCDWRAQQAYQQGLQAAQQQYAQQPQQPPPQYQGQYAPQYGPSTQQQGQGPNPYSQQGRPPVQQPQQTIPQQPQQSPQSPPQTRPDSSTPSELPSSFSQETNRGGRSGESRSRSQGAPSPPPEGESRAPVDNGAVPDGLAAVVGENCLRCHGANNDDQGGSFDLRDLKAVPLEDRAEAYTQVVAAEMPKKSNPLSKEQQLLFKAWYRAAVRAKRTRATAASSSSNGQLAQR